MRSYQQGVVINKIKLSGVAPRKRETTNVESARLSGAFFALANDGSQAMMGVGKPLSHDHLRTEVLFWSKFHRAVDNFVHCHFIFVAQLSFDTSMKQMGDVLNFRRYVQKATLLKPHF